MKFYELDLCQLIPYGVPINSESHVELTRHINEFFLKGFENYYSSFYTVDDGVLTRDYSRSCAAPITLYACQFCTDAQLEVAINEAGFDYYPANDHNINAQFLFNLNNIQFGTNDWMSAVAHYIANSSDVSAEAVYYPDLPYHYGLKFYGDIAASVNTERILNRIIDNLKVVGTAHTQVDEFIFEDTSAEIETNAAVTVTDAGISCGVEVPIVQDDPSKPLYLLSKQDGSTVLLNKVGDAANDVYEQSFDGITWTDTTNVPTTLDCDEGLYIRAKNARTTTFSTSKYIQFTLIGKIRAYNNINSMLTPDFAGITSLSTYCFYRLFYQCAALTKAPLLPATTADTYCYLETFRSCTNLKVAPEIAITTLANYCFRDMFNSAGIIEAPALPVTTLANYCYAAMFKNCAPLKKAPALPATELKPYCYQSMFWGTSLTTAPELPATTLANYCYQSMFRQCAQLTSAPVLPATTLSDYCYSYMFYQCSGLSTAPTLSATNLRPYCYENMFYSTNLTIAPDLPATTLANYCYRSMFSNCSNLNEVHIYATNISATDCLKNWLSNVASTGDFYCVSGVPYTTGASGKPENWTPHNI